MILMFKTTIYKKSPKETDWVVDKIHLYESEGHFNKDLQKIKDWHDCLYCSDNSFNINMQTKLVCHKSLGRDWGELEEKIYG